MFAPAPFLLKDVSVSQVMIQVCVALIPGIAAYASLVGPAILVQIVIATLAALLAEAVMLKLRGKSMAMFLTDGSAIVGHHDRNGPLPESFPFRRSCRNGPASACNWGWSSR